MPATSMLGAAGSSSIAGASSSSSSSPPDASGSDGGTPIVLDLCDSDEDEEGGAFAKQLNNLLAFDDEEDAEVTRESSKLSMLASAAASTATSASAPLHGKRKAPAAASSSSATGGANDAIELDDDDDEGMLRSKAKGAEVDDDEEDADAMMARRLQQQMDDDAAAEESRLAKGNTDDEQLALRIQARLAREIAESEETNDGPVDVLAAQRNKIRHWLAQNAATLKVSDVQPVQSALPGGELYQRFASAYHALRDKSVRLVFHGTREENIDDICTHGLDPSRRGRNGQALGAGEYFAENVQISIPYCGGGKRMLVFAVLMDQTGLTKRQSGIVVVHKPEHQLPLFVLTFDGFSGAMPGLPPGMNAAVAARIAAAGGANAAILAQLRSFMGLGPGVGAPPPPPPPPVYRAPAAPRRGSKAKRRR